MCGIAGFIDFNGGHSQDALQNIAAAMAGKLAHRGPDHQGIWTDVAQGVALAHRRLSIVDLTSCGNQPMTSANGRYIIIYNGEIYNFRDVKTALEASGLAPTWRGASDTEVLLAAVQAWGLETALTKFNGMFAFALYDCQAKLLHVARDRFGEKPLYYGFQNGVFLFASELKALRAHPAFLPDINRNAVAALMMQGNIPAPLSIYGSIYKLLPGHYVTVNLSSQDLRPVCYWSAMDHIETARQHISSADETNLITELDGLLRAAVAQRMIADVPLGAFLSGGIDSSLIVAMMQNQSPQPVQTFSIGFTEAAYNEAHAAKAIARHLGTQHTEFNVTAAAALNIIPKLPDIYDEPFADSSQLVTYLVAQQARRHVTVALTGDGGDELFGGYNRYTHGANIWRILQHVPIPLRQQVQKIIRHFPPGHWDAAASHFSQHKNIGGKLHKLAGTLDAPDQRGYHHNLLSLWPEQIVKGTTPQHFDIKNIGNFIDTMMAQDTVNYLPNDILTKLDRATMAVSLESRLPYLDPALFDFAWRLPQHMKVRGKSGKYILRQVLERYVPPALTNQPKSGFAVPLADWLRGPLRDWANDLLSPATLAQQNIFMPTLITQRWQEHLSGRRNWEHQLWAVLMLQAWYQQHH